jgi:hypothetical protein
MRLSAERRQNVGAEVHELPRECEISSIRVRVDISLKLRNLIITHVVFLPLNFLVIIPFFQIQLVLPTVKGPQMRTYLYESAASFGGMDRLAATQQGKG